MGSRMYTESMCSFEVNVWDEKGKLLFCLECMPLHGGIPVVHHPVVRGDALVGRFS